MEDAVDALKLAFAVFIFVLGLSIVFNMFSQAREVSDYVLEHTDNTYYAKYVGANNDNSKGRTVGIETIIPTLYRYYKEKFSIDVMIGTNDKKNEKFDEEIEGIVSDGRQSELNDGRNYDDLYPDGISWLGSSPNEDTQKRVTSYIEKKANIVNRSTLYKYGNTGLKDYRNSTFTETFTQKENNAKKHEGEDGSVVYLVRGTTKLHITYTLQ